MIVAALILRLTTARFVAIAALTLAVLALGAVTLSAITLSVVALRPITVAVALATLFAITLALAVLALVCLTLTTITLPAVALTVVALAIALITVALPAIAAHAVALVIVAALIIVVAPALVTAAITTPIFGNAGLFVGADRFALETEIVILVEIVPIAALILPGFIAAPALIGQHAEIMVGELQVIFGVHAITGHLRITRHITVFLVQLGRVATCAAVDPVTAVALTAATTARLLLPTTTTATATVLTIVDQATFPRPVSTMALKTKPALLPTYGATFPGPILAISSREADLPFRRTAAGDDEG